jgi:hypothetical protein
MQLCGCPGDQPPSITRNPTGFATLGSVNQEPPLKPDWKDFFALVIAAYQVLLVPVLAMIGVLVAVILMLGLFFG